MKTKNIKRIAACAAVVSVAAFAFACAADNGGKKAVEKPDYSLSFVYDGRGAYTVSGFSAGYISAAKDRDDDISKLSIPSAYMGKPVTAIADGAFNDCDFLYEVTIPDSIAYIGKNAFDGCAELRRIDIGNGVRHIAGDAFAGCDGLGAVLYWGSVADWCEIVFATPESNPLSCAADFYIDGGRAASVRIPARVTDIKPYAFFGCSAVRSVTFSDELKYVGEGAFCGCTALGDVSLGGVTEIAAGAFMYTALKSVILPTTLTDIGENAFKGCNFLYEVYDNAGLGVTRGGNGFGCVGENALDIRESDETSGVKRSGEYVYYRSTSTEKTYLVGVPVATPDPLLPTTETPYVVAPYLYAGTSITSVTLSPSVTEIGAYAFAGCTRLVEITLCKELSSCGTAAFYGDAALKYVRYNGTRADFLNIEFENADTEPSSNPLFNGATLYINGVPSF